MALMGHADHFLRRLDRVADHHVELSLTLYRDEALLKEVLNRAELPPGIGRLAISLEDPIEGPFVIVTREGRFVTCLAKGMLIGSDVALLTRPRLDAAIAKVERMRERMAETEALRSSNGEGVAARIFRRMGEDGLRFCREDAETLLQVWPLVGSEGVGALIDQVRHLRQNRKQVSYFRFDKLRPEERDFALQYGRAAWTASHLLVLSTHNASDATFDAISTEHDARWVMLQSLFELSAFAPSMRALWVLAQRPKQYIPLLKALRDDPRIEMRQLREMGLGVTALASPKVRAEGTKALLRMIEDEGTEPVDLSHAEKLLMGALGGVVRATVEQEDEIDKTFLDTGRGLCAMFARDVQSPSKDPTEEELAAVPESHARAVLANLSLTWRGQAEHTMQLVFSTPWLARARAEELFLPREFAQRLPKTGIEDIGEVMSAYAKSRRLQRPDPVKSKVTAGRNDPCPCGSGKKFKRCCDGNASG